MDKPTCSHINMLMFALRNHIMIDHYAPYKAIMRDFVQISILRQSIKQTVKLNQYELYSAIQFHSAMELQTELRVFSKNKDGNQPRLSVSDECTEWVISTMLPDLTSRLMDRRSLFDDYESKYANCVRLLAFLNLSEAHMTKVMSEFSRLINSSSTTIGTYEAINEFLAHQHILFKRDIKTDVLIEIINTVIDKFTSRTAHGWDQHAILNGTIDNLYGYIEKVKGKYTDEMRVRRLVSELEASKPEEQRAFSRSLLYSIFNISNDNVRAVIKSFIEDISFNSRITDIGDLEFEIWSVAVDFKDFEAEAIVRLDEYLEQFRDWHTFSSRLYDLKALTQYLVKKKEIDALEKLDREMSDLIEKHENRPNISTI